MFTEAFPIVTVPDLPATVRFYRDLLGFRESYRFPDEGDAQFVTLRLGGSELGLAAGEAGRAAAYALCVYADDCDAAVGRLRAAGTTIVEEPADQPWGERVARVLDPDGNLVNVGQRAAGAE